MSDSAPSESSSDAPGGEGAPAEFVSNIGIDLVEVTRADQPICLASELHWGGAGHEEGIYGAPLDRLFGEETASFITGDVDPEDIASAIDAAGPLFPDPIVSTMGLADALMPTWPEEAPLQVGSFDQDTAEFVTLFDFEPDAHADATHMHKAWTWNLNKGAWVFDHYA